MQSISVYCLNKVSNKRRPLLIVLPTHSNVFEILKVKRKLFNVANFTSIRISPIKLYNNIIIISLFYLK